MGGIGSGRHCQFGAELTTDYRKIDIRRWARDGLLVPGGSFGWEWKQNGERAASINVSCEHQRVILSYRHRRAGDEWRDVRYAVYLTSTACHMGGERQWFICPAQGCAKRVALLYGGAVFACRHCFKLAYPSQRENARDGAASRAQKIRDQLGWPFGILEGSGWGKPKGMHWKTFSQLSRQHDMFVDRSVAGMIQHLRHLQSEAVKLGLVENDKSNPEISDG